jgi:hypothetical protein
MDKIEQISIETPNTSISLDQSDSEENENCREIDDIQMDDIQMDRIHIDQQARANSIFQPPHSILTRSEDGKRWSYNFVSSLTVSSIGLAIGTSIIFASPFAGSSVVGVSIITSILAYFIPGDNK